METSVRVMASFLAVVGLSACGGGSGGGGPGGASTSTATFAHKSVGAISALGSIMVNGVKFEVEGAEIFIRGEAETDVDLLKVGMEVEVEGEVNDDHVTGRATRVVQRCDIVGPIESVTPSATGMVKIVKIAGQEVEVEIEDTHFDHNHLHHELAPLTFAVLDDSKIGNVVEVAGMRHANGRLHATFLEKKADDVTSFLNVDKDLFEVRGEIANLSGTTFMINGLTINFAGLTPRNLEDAPGGVLANGVMVEVKGKELVDTTLKATNVEVKLLGLGVDDLAEAEVEGLLMSLDATNKTFVVSGQSVNFSSATFEGGLDIDLADGIKIEAEGAVVAGVLMATKVKFKESIRFEANVDTVDAAAGTITLQGLPGITIKADDTLTEFKNVAGLSGIAIGNNLKIRGRMMSGASNTIIATRIELKSAAPGSRVILQGNASSIDAATGTVTVLGITVNATDFSDAAAFFSTAKTGDLVKIRGDVDPVTQVVTWKQIELETMTQ